MEAAGTNDSNCVGLPISSASFTMNWAVDMVYSGKPELMNSMYTESG